MCGILDPTSKVDSLVLTADSYLNTGAAYPIVGAIPAVLQTAMGGIIMVITILAMVILAPVAICSENARDGFKCAGRNFVNGLGDLLIAPFKIIPGIGCCCVGGGFINQMMSQLKDPEVRAAVAKMQAEKLQAEKAQQDKMKNPFQLTKAVEAELRAKLARDAAKANGGPPPSPPLPAV